MSTEPKTRANSYGPHESTLLHLFGNLVVQGWGDSGYVVGSSQKGERFPRDIDVRVMLETDAFAEFFGDWRKKEVHRESINNLRWRAHMVAWSLLGKQITGMPIDFQVQTLNEANSRYPNEPRNPL